MLLSRVLRAAFERLDNAPQGEWLCGVRITDSAAISALHGQFFGDPTDTDVMSFPSGEALSPDGGYLGDIAISVSMASLQAREAAHSLAREICYLALHGMLHLIGYDDQEPEDRAAMLELQDWLLTAVEQKIGQRV